MNNFERKIKDLLEDKKMNQEILAEKVGITRRTLQNYFSRNSLNTDDLEKIADVLGVSVGYFFGVELESSDNLKSMKDEINGLRQIIDDYENYLSNFEVHNAHLSTQCKLAFHIGKDAQNAIINYFIDKQNLNSKRDKILKEIEALSEVANFVKESKEYMTGIPTIITNELREKMRAKRRTLMRLNNRNNNTNK